MVYEILISGRTNKILHFQEKAKAIWGKKEVEPKFYKRDFDGTLKDIKFMLLNCTYDFKNEQFYDNKNKCVFSSDNIITKEDYTIEDLNVTAVKELNDDITVANPCDYLDVFEHIEREEQRKYFYNLFSPLIKLEGMKKFLWSIENCEYGQIREIMKNLPVSTLSELKKVLSKDDIEAFIKGWEIKWQL